ncbi:MAG: hypothetical protein R3231_04635 [bacterium]|nr:hypothetical protein [bacterium]
MIIEASTVIEADLKTVWQTISDVTCWKLWNTVLEDRSLDAHDSIVEGERLNFCIRPFTFPITFEPEIQEVVYGERIVWTGQKYGIVARHEFHFNEVQGGIEVVSRETFRGLLVAFGGIYFFPRRRIRQLTVSLLEDLKKAVEKEYNARKEAGHEGSN